MLKGCEADCIAVHAYDNLKTAILALVYCTVKLELVYPYLSHVACGDVLRAPPCPKNTDVNGKSIPNPIYVYDIVHISM